LGDKDEVDGQLSAGRLERVERREKGVLGSLLVDRAPSNNRFALTRPVDDSRLEWRRRPFRRVVMLDVVHEVDTHAVLRACIEGCKDAGYAIGWDDVRALESRIEGEPAHVFCAFVDVALFGRNCRQCDPVLQALYV